MSPRFSEENFHKNMELVRGLKEIAEGKGCTAGQLSLAWLLAQGDDVCSIFKLALLPISFFYIFPLLWVGWCCKSEELCFCGLMLIVDCSYSGD